MLNAEYNNQISLYFSFRNLQSEICNSKLYCRSGRVNLDGLVIT
jgi:hypothetical protein